MTSTKYDSYGNDGGDSYDNEEVKFTTHASIVGTLNRVFGVDTPYGQSLGVSFENAKLTDGVVGYDTEKDKYKIFSWEEATGLSPMDRLDRGDTPTADDADDIIQKTYVGNSKTYDVIAARVEGFETEDGTTVESTSRKRDVTVENGSVNAGEWEDLGGDPVPLFNTVTWFNGSEDYGPSATSNRLAKLLTSLGDDMVTDEDNIYDWLADVSGENLLRDDLEGRVVEFFKIPRESDNGYTYHVPIVIDASTGEEVQPNNRGDTGNESSGSTSASSTTANDSADSEAGNTSAAPESFPEPVADYIRTVTNIADMDADRAGKLLDELIADPDNAMTQEHLDDSGGRDVVIQEVV